MRLQETRRERQAARGDPVRFATFEELQAEGHLEDFQVLDRGLTYEVARHADYVFRLSLLSGEASGGAPLPAQRYELWAWPANPAERSARTRVSVSGIAPAR